MDQPILEEILSQLHKTQYGSLVATLVRSLGELDLAEEVLQEAFSIAWEKWSMEGIPENPRAWLISTARFKGVDRLRRAVRGRDLIHQHWEEDLLSTNIRPAHELEAESTIQDNQLRLMFYCCHPTLSQDDRLALTLKAVCGFRTEDIAKIFLVAPQTMKRRLSRAKKWLKEKDFVFEIPSKDQLPDRLNSIHGVIYLVFTKGYSQPGGSDLGQVDLATEAVFLIKELNRNLPSTEGESLLALMLLQNSRKETRRGERGELLALEEQDRNRWDWAAIQEARELLNKALQSGTIGSYTIQGAIALTHSLAPSYSQTDWELIIHYYNLLLKMQDSPVIRLQRLVALGMHGQIEEALHGVTELIESGALEHHHRAYAVQAEFAQRLGRKTLAQKAINKAMSLVKDGPEHDFLRKKLENLGKSSFSVPNPEDHSTN